MNCTLNYEYDKSGIRIYVLKNSENTGISEYIDYSKWSETRLNYMDIILDKAFKNLIKTCNESILNYKLTPTEIKNCSTNIKAIITQIVEENNEKLRDLIRKLGLSIKDWYIQEYPNDDVGETLSPNVTFLDLNNLLNSKEGENVYELLGGFADSIVRERCFEKLSQLTEQSYDSIYNKWLNSEEPEIEK